MQISGTAECVEAQVLELGQDRYVGPVDGTNRVARAGRR
jgi:hypothetical protein